MKDGRIIGRGWNRMPVGCEEKFPWEQKDTESLVDGKHLYGRLHTVKKNV